MSATKNRKPRKSAAEKRDIYQEVTDRIIAAIESGQALPWRKPWKVRVEYGGFHRNLVSKKPYRGVNTFILDFIAAVEGYQSPYWLTFKQARDKGGCVRKGEKGTKIVFFKPLPIKVEENGETKTKVIPLLRDFTVFNVDQCDGIDVPEVPEQEGPVFTPIEKCEDIIAKMPNAPRIQHRENRAYYSPAMDYVNMPHREDFDSPEFYYSVGFHELAHSTGHQSRLNRKEIADFQAFGDEPYSKEELTAEMSSAMLCAVAGIDVAPLQENTAAYIKNWLGKLKDDKKFVVQAAARAQRATDYILDTLPTEEEK